MDRISIRRAYIDTIENTLERNKREGTVFIVTSQSLGQIAVLGGEIPPSPPYALSPTEITLVTYTAPFDEPQVSIEVGGSLTGSDYLSLMPHSLELEDICSYPTSEDVTIMGLLRNDRLKFSFDTSQQAANRVLERPQGFGLPNDFTLPNPG